MEVRVFVAWRRFRVERKGGKVRDLTTRDATTRKEKEREETNQKLRPRPIAKDLACPVSVGVERVSQRVRLRKWPRE